MSKKMNMKAFREIKIQHPNGEFAAQLKDGMTMKEIADQLTKAAQYARLCSRKDSGIENLWLSID